MRMLVSALIILLSAAFAVLAAGQDSSEKDSASPAAGTLLVDDFSNREGLSSLGTRWDFFTDGVMGGRSKGAVTRMSWGGRECIRLRGEVSLENNGGFIQTRLPLAGRLRSFDAQGYRGVRFMARGNGERYAIHLRTSHTILPWQYYEAGFTAGGKWTRVEIPFADFKPDALRRALDPSKLKTIGLVAIKKKIRADVAISDLEFYR